MYHTPHITVESVSPIVAAEPVSVSRQAGIVEVAHFTFAPHLQVLEVQILLVVSPPPHGELGRAPQ